MTWSNEWSRLSEDDKAVIESKHVDLPVKIGQIAQELGLKVKSATLGANISGMIQSEDDGHIIKINRHDVKERQRFTLAHEIAHFLLHEEHIGDGIIDDVLYRSSLSDNLEVEANRLAADILMPFDRIQEELLKIVDKKKEVQNEILAEIFGVSVTAIKIRLGRV